MEEQPEEAAAQPEENSSPVVSAAKRYWKQRERQFQRWLTKNVGLTETLTTSLRYTDDDWTFIIKIHALIEVALNHMVVGGLGAHGRQLSDAIERLSVWGKGGKIAFATALGLLPERCLAFIRLMSEVRRHLVHDAANFDFSISVYMATLEKNKLNEWKKALTFSLGESPPEWMLDSSVMI